MALRSAALHIFGLSSLLAAACQREPEPAAAPADPAPATSPVRSGKPSPAEAPAMSALPPPPAAETPFMGQDLSLGNWIETSAYKFRVASVVRCADPDPSETVPVDRPLRFGVNVEVFSKYDEFFLSPRDVTLEKSGVILNSERNAKPGAGCAAMLQPTRMKRDQTTSGVVVFQVPDESFVRDGTVAFEPTRWGGAPRTEVKITKATLAAPGAGSQKTKSKP